jgi:hypothetical protein
MKQSYSEEEFSTMRTDPNIEAFELWLRVLISFAKRENPPGLLALVSNPSVKLSLSFSEIILAMTAMQSYAFDQPLPDIRLEDVISSVVRTDLASEASVLRATLIRYQTGKFNQSERYFKDLISTYDYCRWWLDALDILKGEEEIRFHRSRGIVFLRDLWITVGSPPSRLDREVYLEALMGTGEERVPIELRETRNEIRAQKDFIKAIQDEMPSFDPTWVVEETTSLTVDSEAINLIRETLTVSPACLKIPGIKGSNFTEDPLSDQSITEMGSLPEPNAPFDVYDRSLFPPGFLQTVQKSAGRDADHPLSREEWLEILPPFVEILMEARDAEQEDSNELLSAFTSGASSESPPEVSGEPDDSSVDDENKPVTRSWWSRLWGR